MDVTIQSENNITVAVIGGRLDAVTAPELEGQISEVLDGGSVSVAFDLTDLEYISSAGLRVILTTAKKLQSAQGKLVLFGLQTPVMQIFDISGFCSVLNIVPAKEDALNQF